MYRSWINNLNDKSETKYFKYFLIESLILNCLYQGYCAYKAAIFIRKIDKMSRSLRIFCYCVLLIYVAAYILGSVNTYLHLSVWSLSHFVNRNVS